MYLCIHFSNLQIVVALLFGSSVAKPTGNDPGVCSNVTLVSKQKVDCRQQQSIDECDQRNDAFVQIQCRGDGNRQFCYPTCNGASSESPNTSKFVGIMTQNLHANYFLSPPWRPSV